MDQVKGFMTSMIKMMSENLRHIFGDHYCIGSHLPFYITGSLNKIIAQIKEFQQGNWQARIKLNRDGELKQLADTFNNMADTLASNMENIRTMEKSRRELIANVSHDLRTPLSTIQGYSETLLHMKDSLSANTKEQYIEIVLKSAEKMKKLVDELFELSKLEAKKVVPRPEPFSVLELAMDTIQKYKMSAEDNGISLKMDASKDIPLAYADIGLIDKVFQNLIDNALKCSSSLWSHLFYIFKAHGGEHFFQIRHRHFFVAAHIDATEKSCVFFHNFKNSCLFRQFTRNLK